MYGYIRCMGHMPVILESGTSCFVTANPFLATRICDLFRLVCTPEFQLLLSLLVGHSGGWDCWGGKLFQIQ